MTDSYMMAAVVVFVLLLAGVGVITAAAAMRTARQTRADQAFDSTEQPAKYPEGHWLGVGMGMGIALAAGLGVPIGIAMDNLALGLALGPGIGVAIGVAIGSSLEQRHKDEIRPLTAEEQRTRRFAVAAGMATLVIGVLAFAAILLVRAQG